MKHTVKSELRDAILGLASRPDIHSISCHLVDFGLWQGLFKEQLARSERLGLVPQEALCLMGPDSGIPGVTAVYNGLEDDDCQPPVLPDDEGNLAPMRWPTRAIASVSPTQTHIGARCVISGSPIFALTGKCHISG